MFEYDPDKSAANLAKHGIDFEQAQALWNDDDRFEIMSGGETEPRWLVIGKIEDRHWTAIYTMRDKNIRIISVRRSRQNKVRDYGSRQNN
jgi:uncharacterized protein